jgi:hypothetical protein
MPSTAKQAKTNAFESIRATPFTRIHGRPTRWDNKILKEEACAPASEVENITYAWSKNATDNYGLLTDILGVNEYDNLTNISRYAIPQEPASYNPTITDTTPTHTRTLGRFARKPSARAKFICNNVSSGFLVSGVGSFQALALVVRCALCKVRDGVNFDWKWKKTCRVSFVRETKCS